MRVADQYVTYKVWYSKAEITLLLYVPKEKSAPVDELALLDETVESLGYEGEYDYTEISRGTIQ